MSTLGRRTNDGASFELELEQAAERMDAAEIFNQLRQVWQALPPDLKQDIVRRAIQVFDVRGAYKRQLFDAVDGIFAQDRQAWQQALLRNRAAAAQQLAMLAGRKAGLPLKGGTPPPGFSDVQVRDYRRRQRSRGYVPGRGRGRGSRELEMELDGAARELDRWR
jgi:hypothetical protein